MFNNYPYTDTHELNLDWIIKKMKELKIEFDEFKVVNTITFSGAWDITKNYPAWTIVSDNNIGYVSIQPVPAGVLLTNGDYWREVIDYTAQIAGLQSRIVTLEGEMDDAQADIIANTSAITTNSNDILDINSFIHFYNIICISDSYGLTQDGDGLYWDGIVKRALGISDANFHRSAINGSGFTDHSGQPTFLDQLTALSPSITNKNKITDIIVVGGCNDRDAAGAQILSDISAFCTYCKTNYKWARIHIAHAGRIWSESELPKFAYVTVPRYSRCGLYGARYIKGSENIMHQYSLFQADKIHPNADGVREIGIAMVEGLLTGTCEIERRIQPTITPTAANILSASFDSPMVMMQQNDTVSAIFQALGSLTVTFTSEATQPNNSVIGTLSDTLMFGGTYAPYGFIEATVNSYNGSNTLVESRDALLYFTGDNSIHYRVRSGGNFNTSAKLIFTPIQSFTVPALSC